jgi:hypothetical protein
MNDSNDLFEDELRALRPTDPSSRVAAAIAAALDPSRPARNNDNKSAPIDAFADAGVAARVRRLRASLWFSWSVAAAAASFAIAVFLRAHEPAAGGAEAQTGIADGSDLSPPADLRVVPVSSSNTLVAARDEGIVYLDGGQPARRVRLQYLDTVRLRAEDDHASIDVSFPREEIRLVPVNAL